MDKDYSHLFSIARRIRRKIIEIIFRAGSGHPGGSLSGVEIGTALFFHILNHNPEYPKDPKRDRFILSKGHAAPLLYALLQESGYFPEEWLTRFRKLDSPLQGHPHSLKCPGVEVSTGSLGQGFSIACGLAWSMKYDRQKNRVFVLMGDDELDEGQVWEAAMFAPHYKLGNLTVFIDRNRLQIDGNTEKVMALEPLADKWKAFGWDVLQIDGHSFSEIINAAVRVERSNRPLVIIADTIKGKGVSSMENDPGWHGKSPSQEEYEQAMMELE